MIMVLHFFNHDAKIINLILVSPFFVMNIGDFPRFSISHPPRVEVGTIQGLLSHLVNGAALAQLTTALWSLQVGWRWGVAG